MHGCVAASGSKQGRPQAHRTQTRFRVWGSRLGVRNVSHLHRQAHNLCSSTIVTPTEDREMRPCNLDSCLGGSQGMKHQGACRCIYEGFPALEPRVPFLCFFFFFFVYSRRVHADFSVTTIILQQQRQATCKSNQNNLGRTIRQPRV